MISSNKKLLIILGCFFVSFSLLFLSTQDFEINTEKEKKDDIEDLKYSKVWDKISIDGNGGWSAFETAGNCTGSGTYSFPYIIEDLEINGSGSGSCIEIKNSDKYFRIENCTLVDAERGITLENVINGKVVNNTINKITSDQGDTGGYAESGGAGGVGAGVYLSGSYNNTFSNNTISNVTGGQGGADGFFGSSGANGVGYGIFLKSDSYQNNISFDNFLDGDPIIYLYQKNNLIINNFVLIYSCNPTNLGKIVLINCMNITLSDNTISNVTGGQGGTGGWQGSGGAGGVGAGVYLSGSYNNTLNNNTISTVTGGQGGTAGYTE